MAGFYFIYDYYLKGLSPDSYRYISGSLRDLKNSLHDECILDKDTFMESMNFTEDKYSIYSEMIYWKYENINRYLLIQNRKPFFNTADLKSCISKRDELLKFLSEEECSLIYKMPSFSEYTPEVYLNNLRTVIELYTDNKYILSALQNQSQEISIFYQGFQDIIHISLLIGC